MSPAPALPFLAALLLGAAPPPRTPVLVELFTSEGCSSCPPADALVRELALEQPVPGVELVVLSEHVAYWNRLGWTDPFSSEAFSRRQEAYAERLSGGGLYTPQAVVDGATQAVGSNRRALLKAVAEAAARPRGMVAVRVEGATARVAASWPGEVAGEVFLAVVDREAASTVTRGENQGLRLVHASVVRRLLKVGAGAGGFEGTVALAAAPGPGQAVVAFVQAREGGPVLAVGHP